MNTTSEETCMQIKKAGIRNIARECELNRETAGLIANGNAVKPSTLAKIVAVLNSG